MALKWRLCALLFLATTLNYLDRQTVSILAPTLQNELNLDNTALGWLFAVFYYAYTFSQVIVGPLMDRFHLRWAFGMAVVLWSAVSIATGLATGFVGLVVFRLLLGIAEAANWPGATRIVARTFEPAQRSLANGFFTSGTSVGALIAPALIFAITSALDWRSAFFVLGGGGVLWFSVWVLSTASPKLEPVWHDDPREGDAPKEKLARIQHGLLPGSQLGWILTAIYLGVGVGNFLCGAGVLTLTRRGRPLAAARRTVFLLATVPLSICAAVPLMRLSPAVFALVAVNIGLGIWVAMYLTMVQDVSAAHVSTALGLLSGCGSLAGAVAMWAVGRVTQHTHSFALPMAAFSVSAVISAIAGWAASRETSLKGGTV